MKTEMTLGDNITKVANDGDAIRNLTSSKLDDWAEQSNRLLRQFDKTIELAENLLRENIKLREALFGEYCKCDSPNTDIDPDTHTIECNYRIVVRRIEVLLGKSND